MSGSQAVFARAEGYVPRSEPVDFCAGGKRAMVDRVEWHIIPDAATAVGALAAGEIDWIGMPLPDLLPLLRRNPDIVVGRLDPIGLFPQCRPNMLQGPTANTGVRQAMLAAVDQREVMQAVMGDDAGAYRTGVGVFVPGMPGFTEAGLGRLGPKPDAVVRAMLDRAGYDGGKVVLLHPTDQPFYSAMCDVVGAAFKRVGINLDDQSMDWGTAVQRRASKAPLEAGGWSAVLHVLPGPGLRRPAHGRRGAGQRRRRLVGLAVRCGSRKPLYQDLAVRRGAGGRAGRQSQAQMQQRAHRTTPGSMPLGQYFQSSAWRRQRHRLPEGAGAGVLGGGEKLEWGSAPNPARGQSSSGHLKILG